MRRTLVFLLAVASALLAKESAPAWVHDAAAIAPKAEYPAKVGSVVLLHEEHLTVAPDGKWSATERGAIKILQPGRHNISAWRAYNTKTGRIRDFRGWLILPSGKEIDYQKNSILDEALSTEYTYDEARAKRLDCDPDAPPGSVFAYEVTRRRRHGLHHLSVLVPGFHARGGFPLRALAAARRGKRARLPSTIPKSRRKWKAARTPGSSTICPGSNARTTARDSNPSPPGSASRSSPPPAANPALHSLKDWAAVSQWLSGFMDPPAEPTAAVRAKAAELTAGAKTEMDKIRAIAAFAQQTNYVEVSMNVERGGGYTPHSAEQVLSAQLRRLQG